MINYDSNNIAQSTKHNMFVCPNIVNSENEDIGVDTPIENEADYESLDLFRNNIGKFLSFEENEVDDDFHYNLMNGKSYDHDNRSEDFTTLFSENTNLSSNMQREVNRILRRIETSNPEIFRFLASRGIPYPIARRLVRRIIVLTLLYR